MNLKSMVIGLALLTGPNVFSQTKPANYTQKIPGTNQEYGMVVIPAGEFMMGSPATERGRRSSAQSENRRILDGFARSGLGFL